MLPVGRAKIPRRENFKGYVMHYLTIQRFACHLCASILFMAGVCRPASADVATFYADYYIGRPTASGELYNARLMTAAHPELPFGTYVRVWRADRYVDVKINDRCRCDIDLSKAAAEALGITGIADVSVEVLKYPGR
jgi:rare lipoprotein A